MKAFSPGLNELIQALGKLPSIGPKSATRLALHLLEHRDTAHTLQKAMDVAKNIHTCQQCYMWCEQTLCPICSDSQRNTNILCIIEHPQDLISLEHTHCFKGTYHVLHHLLNPIEGITPEQLHIQALTERIDQQKVQEVILALSATVEGEATCYYIANLLSEHCKISRLASGIPVGADLEYVNAHTLVSALEHRAQLICTED